jgi:hypothetical protein
MTTVASIVRSYLSAVVIGRIHFEIGRRAIHEWK